MFFEEFEKDASIKGTLKKIVQSLKKNKPPKIDKESIYIRAFEKRQKDALRKKNA